MINNEAVNQCLQEIFCLEQQAIVSQKSTDYFEALADIKNALYQKKINNLYLEYMVDDINDLYSKMLNRYILILMEDGRNLSEELIKDYICVKYFVNSQKEDEILEKFYQENKKNPKTIRNLCRFFCYFTESLYESNRYMEKLMIEFSKYPNSKVQSEYLRLEKKWMKK